MDKKYICECSGDMEKVGNILSFGSCCPGPHEKEFITLEKPCSNVRNAR